MEIIPVVDLMGGEVVHARRGERDGYRPVVSTLAAGSAPLTIAAALIERFAARRLYIADLDAIRGRGGHRAEVLAIARAFPGVELWVDDGDADPASLARRLGEGPEVPIVGSESVADPAALQAVLADERAVLSLDHDAGGRLGPALLHEAPALWPRRLIAMTLARVGAGLGPDFERLGAIIARAGGREVFAAGGARDAADLQRLAGAGAAGVLVATALHDGRIAPQDVAAVG